MLTYTPPAHAPLATPTPGAWVAPALRDARTLAAELVDSGEVSAHALRITAPTKPLAVLTVTYANGTERLRVVVHNAPGPERPTFAAQAFEPGAHLPHLRAEARDVSFARMYCLSLLALTAGTTQ